ncbi:T9SS type A sorting domain-containing protein [bacterium]|nr:T9SS type A sorting domain-containing protein [bacterium]
MDIRLLTVLFGLFMYVESSATIIRVPDDYSSIQGACAASSEGDTVLVAPGEYEGGLLISEHGLTLASHFIIDEDSTHISTTRLIASSNRKIITIDSTVTTSISIIGLTLSGAHYPDEDGGTAIDASNIDLVVRHCIISDNHGDYPSLYVNHGTIEVAFSLITQNSGGVTGGGIGLYDSIVNIIHNNIIMNECNGTSGGGVSVSACSGSIAYNTFKQNESFIGGALYTGSPEGYIENISIHNNEFSGNSATQGGAISVYAVDTLAMYDNIFRDNRAIGESALQPFAGAVFLLSGILNGNIYNNEFYYNSALAKGGAMIVSSNANIFNNLFYKNKAGITYCIGTLSVNGSTSNANLYNNIFYSNTRNPSSYIYDCGSISAAHGTIITYSSNDFYENKPYAAGYYEEVNNRGTLNVQNNFWGDASGPYHALQNPEGLGDSVMVDLAILPFSPTPFTSRWLRAPEPLELLIPAEGDFLSEDTVIFLWNAAPDSTPHDTLRYTLEIADNPEFADAWMIDTDTDTTSTVTGLNWEHSYYWRVEARDIYDLRTYSTETRSFMLTEVPEPQTAGLPREWAIDHIYPNPFNRMTQIVLSVPGAATSIPVQVDIFDLQGRLVDTLHGGVLAAGQRRLLWQPQSAAGMYFIRVTAGNWQAMRKVVYLK